MTSRKFSREFKIEAVRLMTDRGAGLTQTTGTALIYWAYRSATGVNGEVIYSLCILLRALILPPFGRKRGQHLTKPTVGRLQGPPLGALKLC